MKCDLTHSRLCELLHYDPHTGVFRWAVDRARVRAGDVAGCYDCNGYRTIRIDGYDYFAHRLAWFFVHASWPVAVIDHLNRRRYDNRLSNLRDVTQSENLRNCYRADRRSFVSAGGL